MNTSAVTAEPRDDGIWTIRGLLVRHKLIGLGIVAITAVMLAMILVAIFGSKAGAVSDSTTCSQWGSANQDQQASYARLYVREHGPLRGGSSSPARVIAAINNGCMQAYADDVSDNATVVQAISGNF